MTLPISTEGLVGGGAGAETAPPLSPYTIGASAILSGLAGDLGLVWSIKVGTADLSLVDQDLGGDEDLGTDRGLATAVVLSLFTDRRAETDDKPPSGDARDRRGWWADEFAAVEGDLFGSRLWLLDRSTLTNETALRAREYSTEALAWMVEDRVVSSVDVTVEAAVEALYIEIDLLRPGRDAVSFRFAYAWDHLQQEAV